MHFFLDITAQSSPLNSYIRIEKDRKYVAVICSAVCPDQSFCLRYMFDLFQCPLLSDHGNGGAVVCVARGVAAVPSARRPHRHAVRAPAGHQPQQRDHRQADARSGLSDEEVRPRAPRPPGEDGDTAADIRHVSSVMGSKQVEERCLVGSLGQSL